MTGPTEPRPGRHAVPEPGSGAGRSAADLLAALGATPRAGWSAVDVAQQRTGHPSGAARTPAAPRPVHRRYAPETDGPGGNGRGAGTAGSAGENPWPVAPTRRRVAPRPEPSVASAPGIDPHAPAPAVRTALLSAPTAAPAPRTAAMPVAPRLPSTRPPLGEPAVGTATADRFADGHTQPGVSSGASRPLLGGRRATDRAAVATDLLGVDEADLPTGSLLVGNRTPAGDRAGLAARHHLPWDDEPGYEHPDHDDRDARYEPGRASVFEETGGLDLVVDDDEMSDDHLDDHTGDDGDGPGRGGGRRGGSGGGRGRDGRGRKRRRPLAALLSLVVLAALIGGIFVGGSALLRAVNPAAEDYTGSGTGTVDIRVNEGDSLRAIAGTLVESGVIASTGPFVDAAKAHPTATSIQPGVYRMHQQMSGASALDLLLDPVSRQLSQVTVPEGMTVAQVLQRLADTTGTPLADLQAAAANTAALGLPTYANGVLEGFLFPATYPVEPDTAPVDMLRPMVARAVQAMDALAIPADQRLTVLTKASIVQAESGSVEDMGKVARVLENRLKDGMPLQLDTTVNYANGKGGVTTTADDRANPSPYNTYVHAGLPPGAISNPGEQALEAVLSPAPGEWRFFVVVDPHTGDTRFAVTAQEHQQNVLLFQQWLRDHPNG